jgi:hypothetical protein
MFWGRDCTAAGALAPFVPLGRVAGRARRDVDATAAVTLKPLIPGARYAKDYEAALRIAQGKPDSAEGRKQAADSDGGWDSAGPMSLVHSRVAMAAGGGQPLACAGELLPRVNHVRGSPNGYTGNYAGEHGPPAASRDGVRAPDSGRPPIAAELTSAGGVVGRSSETFTNVLRAMVAGVRTQLLAPAAAAVDAAKPGAMAGGSSGDSEGAVFSMPSRHALAGSAFPRSVVDEDPAYFSRLAAQRAQAAVAAGQAVTGVHTAHVATDDRIHYAFDRRESGLAGSSARQQGRRRGLGPHRTVAASSATAAMDASADVLRWAEAQRATAEQRRARCEHVLNLLSGELDAEAGREGVLRNAAARLALASAAREGTHGGGRTGSDHTGASGHEWVVPGTAAASAMASRMHAVRALGILASSAERQTAAKAKLRPSRLYGRRLLARGHASVGAAGRARSGAYSMRDFALARFRIARERCNAADALMRVLEEYRLVPVTASAAYLQATLDECEDTYAGLVAAEEADVEAGVLLADTAAEARYARDAGLPAAAMARAVAVAASAERGDKPHQPRPHARNGCGCGGSQTEAAGGTTTGEGRGCVEKRDTAGAGLSLQNVRPYTRRAALRKAVLPAYPALDEGQVVAAEASSKLRQSQGPLRATGSGNAPMAPDADGDASTTANSSSSVFDAFRKSEPEGSLYSSSSSAAASRVPDGARLSAPGLARPPRPRAAPLRKSQQGQPWVAGGRTDWEESLLVAYDVSGMRESTGLMLDIIKRRPLEPPEGRFSHLLGRYTSWSYADVTPAPLTAGKTYPPDYAAALARRSTLHTRPQTAVGQQAHPARAL